jgi:hypothetical protein
MMSSATRAILALVYGSVMAIAARSILHVLCDAEPACGIYGLAIPGATFVLVTLGSYLMMRRVSSSEREKDMRKVMAADTAAGGGEFGDGGDGGGDGGD